MGRETKWVRPRATEHCIADVFGCITRVWSRHVCQADAAFRESVACSRIYLWSQVTLAVDEGSQMAKRRNASFVVLLHHFWGAANPLFCRISCSQRLLQCLGDRFCITTHNPARRASKTLLGIGFLRPIWCKRLGPQACTKSLFYGICFPQIDQNSTFELFPFWRSTKL